MSVHAHRTALVTGGALRIGRAIVVDLAAHGWTIAIHYNTSDNAAKELAGDIRDEGGQAVAVAADLAREEETAGLLPRAAEEIGPLTCLINNASMPRLSRRTRSKPPAANPGTPICRST